MLEYFKTFAFPFAIVNLSYHSFKKNVCVQITRKVDIRDIQIDYNNN